MPNKRSNISQIQLPNKDLVLKKKQIYLTNKDLVLKK